MHDFKDNLPRLFDVKCHDVQQNKTQTQIWGVTMEEEDLKYYDNQKSVPPIGYCSSSVDRHTLAKTMRRAKRAAFKKQQRKKRDQYKIDLEGLSDHQESLTNS